jgi:hypothetical protein
MFPLGEGGGGGTEWYQKNWSGDITGPVDNLNHNYLDILYQAKIHHRKTTEK